VHRLGCVAVGETSILIACSSTHRNEAHDMVMKLLNDIKAKVPIWKKINFIDSNSDSNKSSEWSDKSEAFWLNK
jgi:molybdopterin synthase catalytic subunit